MQFISTERKKKMIIKFLQQESNYMYVMFHSIEASSLLGIKSKVMIIIQ